MVILPWVTEAIVRQEALKGATHMGKKANRLYIHNIATTMMGQIGGINWD